MCEGRGLVKEAEIEVDAFAATVQSASETPIGLTFFLWTLTGALLNGLVSSCHIVLVRSWSSSVWYVIMYSMVFIWFSSNCLGSLKFFFSWCGMADMADTDIDSLLAFRGSLV